MPVDWAATIWIFVGHNGRGRKRGYTNCIPALKAAESDTWFFCEFCRRKTDRCTKNQRELGIVLCAWETRSQLYCWSDRLTSQYDSRICLEKQIVTQAYFLRKCQQYTACLKSSHACFVVQAYRTIEWLHWISVFFIVLSTYKNYFFFSVNLFCLCNPW